MEGRLDSAGSCESLVVDASEDGEEENSASIKYGEFIHQSGDDQLL